MSKIYKESHKVKKKSQVNSQMQYLKSNEDSAAILAISALQSKIKVLENENLQLQTEYEKIKSIYEEQSLLLKEKKENAIQTTEFSRDLIEKTTTSYAQIQEERELNQELKQQLADIENVIEKQKQKQSKLKIQLSQNISSQSYINNIKQQTEQIIGNLLSPPTFSTSLRPDEIVVIQKKSLQDLSQYSTEFVEIIQQLRSLPKVFFVQKLDVQQDIIETMIKALDLAFFINLEIKNNDKLKTYSERKNNLRLLTEELIILSDIMKQFCFSKSSI